MKKLTIHFLFKNQIYSLIFIIIKIDYIIYKNTNIIKYANVKY